MESQRNLNLAAETATVVADFTVRNADLMQSVCGCNFIKDLNARLQKIQSFSVIFKILKIEHPAIVDVFHILNIPPGM